MVFSSPTFLFLFLPLTLLGYFLCPRIGRNLFLLGASALFYAWGESAYVALLLLSSVFNYGIGLALHAAKRKRRVLAIGVAGNLLALVYFKYWAFAFDTLAFAMGIKAEAASLPLPLGISFFTFQAISYLVDVYRGRAEVQRNPIDLGLYIMLFPQLIAGPIVRYESVAVALRSRRESLSLAASGAELFLIGLGKKLLLANPLGRVADVAFGLEGVELTVQTAWLGVLCYALQIYFDFSGYTDMARGLGRIFGFEFPENFRFPYLSKSVREFWRRWHISLSTWFRDYVYIPLGGGRSGGGKTYLNLWIVFLLCGIWHGASWTFVIWGAAHGAWMCGERWLGGVLGYRPPKLLAWGATVLFLLGSWVVFRAESLQEGWQYLAAMGDVSRWNQGFSVQALPFLDTRFGLVLFVGMVGALNGHGWALAKVRSFSKREFVALGYVARGCGFVALMGLCFLQLAADEYDPFIYFRF